MPFAGFASTIARSPGRLARSTAAGRPPRGRLLSRVAAGVLLAVSAAGCGHTDPVPAAVPQRVVDPVPEQSATGSPGPAPTPAPAVKRQAAGKATGPQARGAAGDAAAGLDRFVAAVQRQLPGVALDRRDEEVAELGQQTCDSLAAGKNTTAVAGELGELGIAEADARRLVVLAQDTACRS